ncbi:hypothetical protein V1525DRAFT_242289 [Lipomyces kononenkoae]|uniref:Uncharacterized protein n=1 Tax=Lipomyces kononenkoae TaxID=34357 RepID=A0ACC3SX60_LIPKO
MEVNGQDEQSFQQPKTAIARVLCLCLMSFRSRPRDQQWRNAARSRLYLWKTSFDHTRSQIPEVELRKTPPDSGYTGSEYRSSEYTGSEYTGSEYPSSSEEESSTAKGRRVPTRSQAGCAPSDLMHRAESRDSSDSDSNQAVSGRKRAFSQVTSSPPTQGSGRQTDSQNNWSDRDRQLNDAKFCTQRCLLGLQQGGNLDDSCPNVKLHRQGRDGIRHPINAEILVQLLKLQLDEILDRNCTLLGICGAYLVPFKLTCAAYGYTVVGKGTTSGHWKEVSREAEVYQVLRKAQGSAVPVFLGTIDLAKVYFLHGAGEIRHMLLMAWGGESTAKLEQWPMLRREISGSKKEIHALGVMHQDLRPDNILWNAELGRALIIEEVTVQATGTRGKATL